jgi:hypothetical protein
MVIACVQWRRPAYRTLRLAYWQHRWMSHDATSDRPVFEERPDLVSRIAAGPVSYAELGSGRFPDSCRMWQYDVDRAYEIPASPEGAGLLFLHRREAPGGLASIVMLEVFGNVVPLPPNNEGRERRLTFRYEVIEPGSVSRASRGRRSGELWWLPGHDRLVKPFRFYGGEPDPNDAARFTVRYNYDNERGTIEGRLLDHGGLLLRVLDGPAVEEAGN